MCSIGEDDFGDDGGAHSMLREEETHKLEELTGTCNKCSAEGVVVKLSCREAECTTCFLAYVRHKFRASLGSSKILPKDADVVLVCDGSPAGVALLDMVHYAQSQNTFKRLHCNMKLLFIDDSFLGHQQPTYFEDVLKILQRYSDVSAYYVSLASKGDPLPISDRTDLRMTAVESENALKTALGTIKPLTSRQDFVTNLRKNVMRSAASFLRSKFVFLPDISPDLATIFLTNISLGRGYSTAHDIALFDDRIEYLKLLRPLKDLNEIEITYYIRLNNLPTVEYIRYGEESDSMASIQNLTKNFVKNLQEKFPSTVSTVYRTGNKIATSRCKEKAICRLCRSQINSDESKSRSAIEYSRIVSELAAGGLEDTKRLEEKVRERLHDDVSKRFCHACRTILRDSKDNSKLEEFL